MRKKYLNKKYLNIIFSILLLIAAGFAVHGLFFKPTKNANEIFVLSSNYMSLSTEKQAYTFAGTAEFKKVESDNKEIGETQNGDKVYEVKGNPDHTMVEVILNKDQSPHLIYSLKK